MKKTLWLVAAFFIGCATYQDSRSQAEKDRDAEIWQKAEGVRLTLSSDQVRGCRSLGIVNEGWPEGLPTNPTGNPISRPGEAWERTVLRFKTAQMGGNAAVVLSPPEWLTGGKESKPSGRTDSPLTAGPVPRHSRPIGEAYICRGFSLRGLAPDPPK